ncbi:pyruvate dehydrogenase complex dihydrolipoamide acetyltransferase [Marinigracilibium pacificum]|uniref:Acetyltransferase component of pyruvate dehydrogenase complex n=1 Tax=Marinigracilibium pacificum TaxID=2729599 RepID=A0A848J860_9BACT|nr:pyruvate dehydrogenase complex dihydrolipoamide acetyltransferase [Marinigracilibium pacificum]NMM49262.1 pyruvate dehydrogenase complex dihydrolipoamide acetyltransferase [Marinigracilibium pacificum]
MAEVIRMPKMSDTMEEGVIAQWLVKEGDKVSSGDILAEVETDKATMELESYEDGTILYIGVQDKEAVPVNGVIAIIGEEGENIDSLLNEIKAGGNGSSDDSGDAKTKSEPASKESTDDTVTEEIDTSDVNAELIRMPKMSDTMQEGTIAAWHKKVGDKVESGDILAEVETDKATMELEAYEDGTLLYIGVEAGDSVEIDGVIAIIGEEGADFEKLLKASSQKPAEKKEDTKPSDNGKQEEPAKASGPVSSSAPAQTTQTKTEGGRIKASPLAKKLAEDKGFDIRTIKGSGEGGRIVKRDVENHTPQQAAVASTSATPMPASVGQESFEEHKVSQMRKTIAKRLAESKFTAPHFYLTMEINMDKAIEARTSINEVSPVKVSFNDMVIKAVAAALKQHPQVNSSWLGDTIRINHHIHVGMAVAVEEGLLVPVIRFTDTKTLSQIAAETKDLGGKAKNKQLQPADWEGNTFTVSNLGMFGIEEFTAIINPPDACILAVGGIKQTPIVKDGQIVPGNVMKVTLSCDHRVVDGAVGSAFLKTLKSYLEDPVRILV